MAFELEHTTDDGVTHPKSYWKVAETNINIVDQRGRVSFVAYHDAKARAEGRRPIDQRSYPVGSEEYDEFFAPAEIDPAGMNHVKAAYAMILAAKEIGDAPKPDREGFIGPDRRTSFFADALVV